MDQPSTPPTAKARVSEIDLARGVVIVLMALDHVRDYFFLNSWVSDALDPATTNAALYTTRWITHLCAPTFVFLAGVSAYLQHARGKTGVKLATFLATRGLWLIVIELTVVSFAWDFVTPWMLYLQVIWAIGVSMMVLAALVFLPRIVVLGIGLALMLGHNLLHPLSTADLGWIWAVLHDGGLIKVGGEAVGIFYYPVLPWVGVMAAGYGAGAVFTWPELRRTRALLTAGAIMLVAFVLLRGPNLYGDPQPWAAQPTFGQSVMAFLDVEKYPPSLSFLLVTLGAMFMLTVLLGKLRGTVRQILEVFGSTPFFFYVAHIYLLHALAIVVLLAAGQDVGPLFGATTLSVRDPEQLTGLGLGLPWVYLAWAAVVALLYPLCRWFADVKKRRRDWWLSYL